MLRCTTIRNMGRDVESTLDCGEPADPSKIIEGTTIEQQEHERRCKHLSFAFARLGETERRVVKKSTWTARH
jgi:hypothetical protein